jgi:hypothetical protein
VAKVVLAALDEAKHMLLRPWLAALGVLLASSAVQAQTAKLTKPEFELAGFALGTPFDRFASDPRYQCEAGRTSFADKTCRLRALESVSINGTPVEFMTFMFLEQRLYAITASFNPTQFAAVSNAMRKPYGVPATSAATPNTNSPDSETLEWKGKQSELLLRKVNMMGRSDVRLWSPEALNQALQMSTVKPRR